MTQQQRQKNETQFDVTRQRYPGSSAKPNNRFFSSGASGAVVEHRTPDQEVPSSIPGPARVRYGKINFNLIPGCALAPCEAVSVPSRGPDPL